MSLADSGQQRERPEAEVLFLPGKGRFSGRADCNVLVVLEASKRASRLARKAHVVVTDEPPGQMAVEFVFPLDGFRQAMNTLG